MSELLSKSGVTHKLIVNEIICEPVALSFFLRERQGQSLRQLRLLVVAKEVFFHCLKTTEMNHPPVPPLPTKPSQTVAHTSASTHSLSHTNCN